MTNLSRGQIEAHVQKLRGGVDVHATLKALRETGALIDGSLRGSNLREAYLYGSNLRGANLRGANLYGSNLRGANLYGANLREANLRGAYLYGANLSEANLREANLHGADLYGSNLHGAYLYGANLRGAYLREADLRGAYLRGANLENITVNWASHNLIAEILRQQATNFQQRQFAALFAQETGWCWADWMSDTPPEAAFAISPDDWEFVKKIRAWGVEILTPYLKDDEVAPWAELDAQEES